jgi:5'-3' exoribonuclease 2
MGVPAFFRWLSEKYPKIVQDVLEDRVHLANDSGSIRMPFDSTLPNPSGLECDNLYIDMNGIIHPCSHPEVGPQPTSTAEMYENVCRYVDRLVRVARPRKLLYLAIDGVAPRAKMNQQRSRRFRSAQEARENVDMEEKIMENMKGQGHKFVKGKAKPWDSNVITPGTKFMLDLSEYIRFYIRKRISTDPAWKQITVLFSDASVPGEGEHKIMAHVRHQRNQPNFNPNLVHILHGLDADLIMLALATHEAHFYIMREEVVFGRRGAETAQHRRNESGFADAQKQMDEMAGSMAMELTENKQKPLQRVSIPILREYLANEFRECATVPFKEISFERLIDDIVFLCFFVGNDFLPHLPSLDIRDGALDFLFNVYKRLLPSLGDYITNHGGEVNLSHVDIILSEVGAIEDHVFQMKHQHEESDKLRRKQYASNKKNLTKNGQAPTAKYLEEQDSSRNQKVRGKAARILEKQNSRMGDDAVSLGRCNGKSALIKTSEANSKAAQELRQSLLKGKVNENSPSGGPTKITEDSTLKRESSELCTEGSTSSTTAKTTSTSTTGTEDTGDDVDSVDENGEPSEEELKVAANVLKAKTKEANQKKLDRFAQNVDDKVRLHEKGWKVIAFTF